jgi:hypothetical protein
MLWGDNQGIIGGKSCGLMSLYTQHGRNLSPTLPAMGITANFIPNLSNGKSLTPLEFGQVIPIIHSTYYDYNHFIN